MSSVSAPCVMVSSTFYDLRQIRADLEEFLAKDLGYHPLLSEFPSFPVDPDKTTIENCRRRVQQNADVVVLVIGGRGEDTGSQRRSILAISPTGVVTVAGALPLALSDLAAVQSGQALILAGGADRAGRTHREILEVRLRR